MKRLWSMLENQSRKLHGADEKTQSAVHNLCIVVYYEKGRE